MNEKKKSILFLFITELIIFLPKVYVIVNTLPFTDIKDEVAMLAVPAYFAGYDWKSCMEVASYYGFGYFILFTPLFKFNLDIVQIYKIILFITALIEMVIPLMIFYILRKFYKIENDIQIMLVSIISSFITVNPIYNLINEHILIIIVWVIVLIFLRLLHAETKKEKHINSAILALVLIYGMLLHTRFITLIIAIVIVLLLYRIIRKNWIVTKIFPAIFIIGYLGNKYLIRYVQLEVWGNNNLTNASVNIRLPQVLTIFETIEGIFKVILSNVGTLFVFSKSFVAFAVCALTYFVFININVNAKRKREVNVENTRINDATLIIVAIFTLCIGATMLALGMQNAAAFKLYEESGEKIYSIKSLTYLRYYLLYTIPLFFVALILLVKEVEIYVKTCKIGVIVGASMYCIWLIIVAPVIEKTYYGVSSFYPFSSLIGASETLNWRDYCAIILLMLDFLFIIGSLLIKRSRYMVLIMLSLLLMHSYIYLPKEYANPVAEKQYAEINATYHYILKDYDNIKTIYVSDKRENEILSFMYQGYLYQKEIIRGVPTKLESDEILVSNFKLKDWSQDNVIEIELDKNEWIYVTGTKQIN